MPLFLLCAFGRFYQLISALLLSPVSASYSSSIYFRLAICWCIMIAINVNIIFLFTQVNFKFFKGYLRYTWIHKFIKIYNCSQCNCWEWSKYLFTFPVKRPCEGILFNVTVLASLCPFTWATPEAWKHYKIVKLRNTKLSVFCSASLAIWNGLSTGNIYLHYPSWYRLLPCMGGWVTTLGAAVSVAKLSSFRVRKPIGILPKLYAWACKIP